MERCTMMERDLAFLISSPYSGATLLSILMNQHPAISSDGELFPYVRGSRETCSCGKQQILCPYYRSIAGEMVNEEEGRYDEEVFYYVPRYNHIRILSRAFEGFWMNETGYQVVKAVRTHLPQVRKLENKFVQLHSKLYNRSLNLRDASVYFDGTKSLRRVELFAERGLVSKTLHLVRDGRAFCHSFIKNKGLSMQALGTAARIWRRDIRKAEIIRRRYPDIQMLDVRFEDLCRDTRGQLSRIFEFLAVPYDDAAFTFRKDEMHVLGNRMRFKFAGIIKEDDAWVANLGEESIRMLNELMRDGLERFGYLEPGLDLS